MISLVWAMDENWLVGKGNKLPWHIKEDLAHFKAITNQKEVLMGDLTYESMKMYYKNKPFPFKKVYVANLEDKHYDDAILIKDIDSFLSNRNEELFVIGGPTIYSLSLKYAKHLYITFILDKFKGDVYFNKFDLNSYKVLEYRTSDKLIFTKYERR